jgi:type II secretory ATPase GspE/PulE/Tfp pilus assembly ATPase PilB-like protein
MTQVTLNRSESILTTLSDFRLSGDHLLAAFQQSMPHEEVEKTLKSEMNVDCEDITTYTPSGDVLRALPSEAVRGYPAMPLAWEGETLKVAVLDPTDLDVIQDLHLLAQAPIHAIAAERNAMEAMIAVHFKSGRDGVSDQGSSGRFVDFTAASGKTLSSPGSDARSFPGVALPRVLRSGSGDSPIIRLVHEIISEAIHSGSSDIHFEPFERDLKVRLRQDGMLRLHRTINARSKAEVLSRLKIMANMDIAEKRRPQDGRIRMEGAGQGIDVRVSTLPTEHGEKVVLRILDKGAVPLDLSRLGLDAERQAILEKALRQPYGMILMTGPTGAGKTTTLYSCLNTIKSPEVNIVTVEDPIEYKLDGIIQSAVKKEVDYTFANALRTILRQDPNIIMVGEIRDRDTAEIAVRAALTAIARLLDMGIEPFLLASALTLVGAQRLVRRVCPNCAGNSPAQGRGCHACNRTGYSGRIGVYEIMPVSEGIRTFITEKRDSGQIRDLAVKEGMLGLREDGMAKAQAGWTTMEEVLRETA